MRKCGVLLPVFSLPSKYGIGCFSKEAYEFIDQMREAGQSYWQILPLGQTGYGDSPYQSFSTFAGNPYFIDLETLVREELLTESEIASYDFGNSKTDIDYSLLYKNRFEVLKIAYRRDIARERKPLDTFCKKNRNWLEDYALFMAVKNAHEGRPWSQWEEELRTRDAGTVAKWREDKREQIEFYNWQQYQFQKQWLKLKAYAHKKEIEIIGDIPIYVALDSADTWVNPELFCFDDNLVPEKVAGCPPDAFSEDGQLWGNPLYNWQYHEKTGYDWWIQRMRYCMELYDVVRVDHFRGFDEYYAIPYGARNARDGKWEKGPGIRLFDALHRALWELPIIAEDLGFLTESVVQLLKDTGFPGMKVLEFAFDPREASDYMPFRYGNNCVVYTGTHDNQTVKSWYDTMDGEALILVRDYLNLRGREDKICEEMIREALKSVADTAIIPMQDYLELTDAARINEPSTLGKNWRWRMRKGDITPELIARMKRLACITGRMGNR